SHPCSDCSKLCYGDSSACQRFMYLRAILFIRGRNGDDINARCTDRGKPSGLLLEYRNHCRTMQRSCNRISEKAKLLTGGHVIRKLARICIICVLALVVLALIPALINRNFQSEPDTTIPPEIDQNALIADASAYFERMCKGDFSTFHEALPSGIKSQTT